MRKMLAAGLALAGVLLSGGAGAQAIGDGATDGVVATTEVAFFVTLDRNGGEETILETGGLRLLARCDLGGGIGDRVALVVESRVDDWFVVRAGRITIRARPAGEVILGSVRAARGAGLLEGLAGREIVLAPDGTFLSLGTGSTVLGVNVLDHGCVAIGRVDAIRGTPDATRDRFFDDDGLRFQFETDTPGGRFQFGFD